MPKIIAPPNRFATASFAANDSASAISPTPPSTAVTSQLNRFWTTNSVSTTPAASRIVRRSTDVLIRA